MDVIPFITENEENMSDNNHNSPCSSCRYASEESKTKKDYYPKCLQDLMVKASELLKCTGIQLRKSMSDEPLCKTESTLSIRKKIFSCIKTIYEFISGDQLPSKDGSDTHHDDITRKVYRRLQLRHTILRELEEITSEHAANVKLASIYEQGILSTPATITNPQESQKQGTSNETETPSVDKSTLNNSTPINNLGNQGHRTQEQEKENQTNEGEAPQASSQNYSWKSQHTCNNQPFILLPPSVRAYNLAVTDLFVEKALAYLNRKARIYNRHGFILMSISFLFILYGIYLANNGVDALQKNPISNDSNILIVWAEMIKGFIKSFTLYGLIILISVYGYRMSKALFDQAERIKDRRHALRQGRLFVHLNGGQLSIDEMEKAFNWNVTQDNAFSHFNPDAQAPWGNVLKEMLKTIRETSKYGMEAVKKLRPDEK